MSSYVPYIFVIVFLTITFIACWKYAFQDIKYTNRIGNTGKILLPCPFCGREILFPCPICGEMRGEADCIFRKVDNGEGSNTWECSECEKTYYFEDGMPHENSYHYCPNCGRRIQEELWRANE